jgi:hypothetical protein
MASLFAEADLFSFLNWSEMKEAPLSGGDWSEKS